MRKFRCVNKVLKQKAHGKNSGEKTVDQFYNQTIKDSKPFKYEQCNESKSCRTTTKNGKEVFDKEYCNRTHGNTKDKKTGELLPYETLLNNCKNDKFCIPNPPPSKYATFKLNPIKTIKNKLLKNGYTHYTISELNKLIDPSTTHSYTPTNFDMKSINELVKKRVIGANYKDHYHLRFDYLNVEDETGHKSKVEQALNSQKYLQYLQIKYTYAGWNEPSGMTMKPYYTFIIPSIIVYILVGLFFGVMVDQWIGALPRRAAPAPAPAPPPAPVASAPPAPPAEMFDIPPATNPEAAPGETKI